MDLRTVLPLVAPRHREQFILFVKTGEATRKFRRYLDRSPSCQLALERVLRTQWDELAHLFGERLDRSRL